MDTLTEPEPVKIRTSPVFQPLLAPARYKGAWGGRGSGKSHFFAGLVVREHCTQLGSLSVCIREVQKSLKESAKRTIERQLSLHGLRETDGFRSYTDRIATPGDGLIIFVGMQDHTAESLKSLEGYHRAWVEHLGAYHAKRDEQRLVDLGPEHDWASHAADAFGMMSVVHEEPEARASRPYRPRERGRSWLTM